MTELTSSAATQKTHILVVDDDELIRALLRNVLERQGYRVTDATNGEEGVAKYLEHRPDIVITDMLMPGKEGSEVIREIRAVDTAVKIVAMSGGGFTHDMSHLHAATQIGADRQIKKPFTPKQINEILKELLDA
jgi:CheY-like chemotaxis protein